MSVVGNRFRGAGSGLNLCRPRYDVVGCVGAFNSRRWHTAIIPDEVGDIPHKVPPDPDVRH